MGSSSRMDRRISRVITFALALVASVALGAAPVGAQKPATAAKQAVVTVKGMQCPFCAYGIKKHLAKIPGAQKVEVDLAKNRATVDFAPDARPTDAQIQHAVKDAGFTPGQIEWRTVGSARSAGA